MIPYDGVTYFAISMGYFRINSNIFDNLGYFGVHTKYEIFFDNLGYFRIGRVKTRFGNL